MHYDILTYTCESTEHLLNEIQNFESLLHKTGMEKFEVIDLLNRTGFMISQFRSQSDLLRGQAINAEIMRQLIEAKAIDSITAQAHQGRTLYTLNG